MAEKQFNPRPGRLKDISGQRFGLLTVISIYLGRHPDKQTRWNCVCDCGGTIVVRGTSLKRGDTKSCGCYRRDIGRINHTTHDLYGTKEHAIWNMMKQRCHNPHNLAYGRYGGRGITVCDAWRSSFLAFLDDMGHCPPGLTLDRRNNDLGYNKENCRWATRTEQARNKSTTIFATNNGETLPLKEWAERTGICYGTLWDRLKHGLPLFAPVDESRRTK